MNVTTPAKHEISDGDFIAVVQTKAELSARIAQACATSPAFTKERRAALARIRWVLKSAEGRYVQAVSPEGDATSVLLPTAEGATVYDGRDNESIKARFFNALFHTSFSPELV